jgi:hypothetical protein
MAEQSVRAYLPPYDLYKKRPVSDSVEHGFLEYYYSKNALNTDNLEYVVEGNGDHLIVPKNTFIRLKLKLEGKAERPAAAPGGNATEVTIGNGALVSVVNNPLHSIIESTTVYLSNKQITKSEKHNGYIAYIQTALSSTKDQMDNYLELSGWRKDTQGQLNTIGDGNLGFRDRRAMFTGGTPDAPTVELIGRLHHPLFFQEKVLPTQVTMKIILKKKEDAFVLLHEAGTFSLKIEEAVLMVQKVRTVPSIQNTYIQMMEDGHPIPYFLKTPSVNYMTIEAGQMQFMRDNLFLGRMPRKIVLGMVDTNAYQGRRDLNPYNFQHFGLTEICLYKDGVPYPRPMINMDFQLNQYSEAYHHFMTSLNGAYSRLGPNVTMADYRNGYTLFSYDMSPDQLGSVHPGSIHNANSNIRLEMKFKAALAQNVTLIVFSEEEHLMEIHRDRRVTVNY